MIHIEIVGLGGWFSVFVWALMTVAGAVYFYRMGKWAANDAHDQAEHDAWMARRGGSDG